MWCVSLQGMHSNHLETQTVGKPAVRSTPSSLPRTFSWLQLYFAEIAVTPEKPSRESLAVPTLHSKPLRFRNISFFMFLISCHKRQKKKKRFGKRAALCREIVRTSAPVTWDLNTRFIYPAVEIPLVSQRDRPGLQHSPRAPGL